MTEENNKQSITDNEQEVEKVEITQEDKDVKEKTTKRKKKKFFKKCEKCDEYKTGWARAQADYQNLVKETEKNRGEWAQYSERQILEEFIPVYDNFVLAFNHQPAEMSDEEKKWAEGVSFIMKQYGKVLEDHGVIEIRTVGDMFDPELHEAISEEESKEEAGKILKEVAVGYKMGNKVIRPAKVVVSK